MQNYLTLHRNGCLVMVGDSLVRVENSLVGCIVSPQRLLCNVWSPTDDKRSLRFQVLQFQAVPSKSIAKAYAVALEDWVLQLYCWDEGSYVVELWRKEEHTDVCEASLEWWNNEDGVTAYVEGATNGFIRFAETVIKSQTANQNTEHSDAEVRQSN